MSIQAGTHRLGPDNASLQVKTYRQGVASKAGHDLVIDVTSWEATVDVGQDGSQWSVELRADPRSLHVLEGHRGVKPLSDKDRAEIRKNIDAKVLKGQAIEFRSGACQPSGDQLSVRGELDMNGTRRPVEVQLEMGPDGRVRGTIPLTQSDWGIKPFTALMGALKVRDSVEVVIDCRLPPG